MAAAQDRRIATYSKGMRQRIKVAAALVHDPEILLLDEPFNGMDPRQRLHMMDLLGKLGAEGRVILFSSHILEEVETAVRHDPGDGRRAARRVRGLPRDQAADDEPPARVQRPVLGRQEARRRARRPAVHQRRRVHRPRGLQVRTSDFGAFCAQIAVLTRENGIALRELLPTDESLESVFGYLIAGSSSSSAQGQGS